MKTGWNCASIEESLECFTAEIERLCSFLQQMLSQYQHGYNFIDMDMTSDPDHSTDTNDMVLLESELSLVENHI